MSEELEWLKHANETIEKLRAELAQIRVENGKLKATVKIVTKGKTALIASEDARQTALIYSEIVGEKLAQAKAELAKVMAAATESDKHANETIANLRAKLDRLSTDYKNLRETYSELYNATMETTKILGDIEEDSVWWSEAKANLKKLESILGQNPNQNGP